MQALMSFKGERGQNRYLCHKGDMPSPTDTALYDLLKSIQPEGLSENAWLSRAQVNRNFLQGIKGGKRPRSDLLERLIVAAGMTPAQFFDLEGGRTSAPRDDGTPKSGLPFQRRDEPLDLPLMGTAQGSDLEIASDGTITFVERMDLDMANVVEHLRRPASLANRRDVYAITVIGNSMADRYEDGDPAYVDPRRQPRPGDFVVVQLMREEGDEGRVHLALLKQFVRKTSSFIELRQRNPDIAFDVPLSTVHAVHRVIPWREIVFF